jgi:uncharacterized membrane protein YtjA (UPF0391 family)
MLYYALVFLWIALVAVLGFGDVSIAFAGIAKILFLLFIVLSLASLILNRVRRA